MNKVIKANSAPGSAVTEQPRESMRKRNGFSWWLGGRAGTVDTSTGGILLCGFLCRAVCLPQKQSIITGGRGKHCGDKGGFCTEDSTCRLNTTGSV
jgi:hypothetical protein